MSRIGKNSPKKSQECLAVEGLKVVGTLDRKLPNLPSVTGNIVGDLDDDLRDPRRLRENLLPMK